MVPAISVIVPIYNVEKYLTRCVESLLSQTLENIEIILINDGSTDGSGAMADEFAAQDKRIRVIHQKNVGLGLTRNVGLEVARGEYIGFVDSDDWVRPEMYETLYNAGKTGEAEIVMGDFYTVNEAGETTVTKVDLQQGVYQGNEIVESILLPMFGAKSEDPSDIVVPMCVWRNIYKREFLNAHNIRFVSERKYISEDIVFNADVLTQIKRASIVNMPLYYYSFNVNSLTKSYKPDRFEKECVLYTYMVDKLSETGLLEEHINRPRRTFIGRVRTCMRSEACGNRQQSVFVRIRNIHKMASSSLLTDVLSKYPISDYPLKLRLVTYCMKYRWAALLFLIFSLIKPR